MLWRPAGHTMDGADLIAARFEFWEKQKIDFHDPLSFFTSHRPFFDFLETETRMSIDYAQKPARVPVISKAYPPAYPPFYRCRERVRAD
jgi:hypothetical protein